NDTLLDAEVDRGTEPQPFELAAGLQVAEPLLLSDCVFAKLSDQLACVTEVVELPMKLLVTRLAERRDDPVPRVHPLGVRAADRSDRSRGPKSLARVDRERTASHLTQRVSPRERTLKTFKIGFGAAEVVAEVIAIRVSTVVDQVVKSGGLRSEGQ